MKDLKKNFTFSNIRIISYDRKYILILKDSISDLIRLYGRKPLKS